MTFYTCEFCQKTGQGCYVCSCHETFTNQILKLRAIATILDCEVEGTDLYECLDLPDGNVGNVIYTVFRDGQFSVITRNEYLRIVERVAKRMSPDDTKRCQCVPYERCKWCAENCTKFDSNETVDPWVWNASPAVHEPRQAWAYVQKFEVEGYSATFRFQTKAEYEEFEKDHSEFRKKNIWGGDLLEKLLNRENIYSCCIEQDEPYTYEQLIFNNQEAYETFAAENLNPL